MVIEKDIVIYVISLRNVLIDYQLLAILAEVAVATATHAKCEIH